MNTEKEQEFENYRITTLDLSKFYYEEGRIIYELPYGFNIEKNNIAYKVEELKNKTITYLAAIEELEDGTIAYYAPLGGTLSGNVVIVKTTECKILIEELAEEIIERYLENNNNLRLGR